MALQKAPLSSSPANVPPSSPTPPTASSAPSAASAKPVVGKAPVFSKRFGGSSAPFWIGLGISIGWVSLVIAVISRSSFAGGFGGVSLADWAIGISAAVSPVAMVWMITAYLQRATDIRAITEPLRRQLTIITGESGAADARIRRFNQAIREQIDLLRGAQTLSQDDLEGAISRINQHRADFERFEDVSAQQVREIQDVVRRSMFQVEQMMDDKFTMLRVLDGKLQQNGDSISHRIENVGEQVAKVLATVEESCEHIAGALERAERDSQKLAETSRLQESSLTNAAETAAEILGGLSSKIDLNVARFLERASSAREEAELLAQSLDAQTRSLDDFSATMPVRVSEAESIMRGVADRLYASEEMARDQATSLSEKLSGQVDALHGVLDKFSTRFGEADSRLEGRRGDLDALLERIGSTTAGFFGSWEKSVSDLNDRLGNSLLRFTVVNDETRQNAEFVTTHLNETSAKYEDVVTRMRELSTESGAKMKGMTEEMSSHLSLFEKLSAASSKAGEDVQVRAAGAIENLQRVLERVLAARDATQSVGHGLVRDIDEAVTQNERIMQRLSEAAQLGAKSVGLAAEGLGRQEGELVGKARASEAMLKESAVKLQEQAEVTGKSLREQTANLMNLLAEAQGQLMATDRKLQSFATQAVAPVQKAMEQIDLSADQGLRTLSAFNEGMVLQVDRLKDFHTRIGDMGQEVSKSTAEAAGVFESLNDRFATARQTQAESVHHMLAQFGEMAERLQREVSGLDGRAAQAVELLQQAAVMVGEQSSTMTEKAKDSRTQISEIAASLQAEAAQIQEALRKQAEAVGEDLALAERRFSALGEIIREKADTTHAALDQTAARYTQVSEKLDATVTLAQGKVETLHNVLERQVEQIGEKTATIGTHSEEISASSAKAISGLDGLKDKMAETHGKVVSYSDQTLGRLDQTAASFQDRTVAMVDAAQSAADSVIKSGAVFDQQAGKLVNGSLQIADVLSRLTLATDALSEKASTIRSGMEEQNDRLLSLLTESVSKMGATSDEMKRTAHVASEGADQVSSRFVNMMETAGRAETVLSTLGANVTQQAATLAVVGEQLTEQQKLLADAHDKQRTQMLTLFDKLNEAHEQASGVAERAISSLSSALKGVDEKIGTVGEKSVSAIGNVKAASVGFSEQSVLFLQNAQAAEQQARAVLQVTSALQEQAAQLRAGLQSESDRASQSLTALLDRLTKGGDDIRVLGSDTEVVLSTLHRSMGDKSAELNAVMGQISERQSTLTAALDAQRETISALLDRLTAAQDQTAAAAENAAVRLAEGAQKITQNVEVIDARAQDALTNVQRAVAGFGYETEAIEKKSKQVEEDTNRILESASGMRTEIDALRNSMREEGDAAHAMLGALLDQVKTGAGDLREVSSTTEKSLSGLSEIVVKHGADLSSSMKDIDDKQTVLVSALDAQRETISGLLTRFAQAQDESVVVAERTAMRLNEEAQSITTSIDMIGAQASTTLGAVQTSVSGFAEQAVALKLQSQQAEEQVRHMASSTSEMQAQAQTVREALQSDTDRIVELLSGVIQKLDAAGLELRAQTSDATKAFDQTGDKFSTLTKAGADVVQTQTQALALAIEQTEKRMEQANEKARGQIKLVNEFGEKAEAQSQQLANVAEFATTRLVALRDTISDTDKKGADIVAAATTRIDEVKATLEAQLQHLAEFSKASAEEVVGASRNLTMESDILRANLASSESALAEAAALVREEAKQLPSVIGRSVSNIQSAGEFLKEQTAEADKVLIGTADRFISVTASTRNNMAEEIKRVGVVAEDASKVLNGFNQLLAEQVAGMQQGAAMLSSEQQELIEKASHGVEALSEASQKLVSLRTEASSMAERLVREFGILDQRAATTGGRLAQTGEEVAKQVGSLTEATQALAQQSDALRTNLASSETALASAAKTMREENTYVAETVGQSVSKIEAASQTLRDKTVEADRNLTETADRLASVVTAAHVAMSDEMKHVKGVAEDAGKILNGFNQLLAEQVASMQQSTAMLSGEQRELIERANLGVETLAAAGQRLVALRTEASSTAERLAHEFGILDQRAAATGGRLAQAGDGIAKQVEAIGAAAADAEGRMSTVSNTMREQLDRIRGGLQGQIDDISRGLLQITAQLERTGGNLRSTAVGAVADVERVGQRFEQTGAAATAQVKAETEKMRKTVESVASMISGFGEKFDQMIDHMAQAGADLKSQEGSSVDHLQRMLGHLGTIAEKLESARTLSGDVSKQTVERLGEVVSEVQAQMNKMTANAQTAAGIMRGIGQIYNDQTTALTKGMTEAHGQVVGMNKSIDEMQDRTDRMRTALKLQGEDLMSSLRLILAQLEMTGDGFTDAVNNTLRQQQASAGSNKAAG